MTSETSLRDGVARLARARQFSESVLLEFQAAIMRYDWPAADDARVRYLAAAEATLDELAALYRAMQIG